MKKIFCFLLIAISGSIYSQLTVTNGYTATQLGNTLAGSNVTITGATISGMPIQYGKFQFAGSGFPLSDGIILSNGNIFDAPGPNSSSGISTATGGPGNPLLTALCGNPTYDAVLFQFDFQVQSDNIEFQYIFASDEYNEFVGSGFNDVFGFFISGPGITGEENLAVVPTTTDPVTINNINNINYWQFYNDNETGTTNIEYDGYTTVLTAQKTGLIPCSTYTLKLIIADASDAILDAAVFLKANSLIQQNISVQSNTISANGTALEGCVQASFTFNLDTIYPVNTIIPFQVGGTAIEGIDYQNLDTALIIPAGQSSATIFIDAIADGLPEGVETIDLIYQSSTCGTYDTVTLNIDDYTPIQFATSPNNPTCAGSSNGSILFSVTGGLAPYTYSITDSTTNVTTNYTSNPVTGLDAGTYFIEVTDVYGCQADDVVSGNLFDGGPVFLPDGNGNAYTDTLMISGFAPGQTLTSLSQFQSVCMNIEHSRLHELEIFLTAPNGFTITLKQQPGGGFTNLGEPQALAPSDHSNPDVTPGVGYDYCFTPSPTYGTMVSEAGTYTYTYTPVLGGSQTDTYLPAGSYQSYDPLSDLIGVPLNGPWILTIEDHTAWNNGYLFSWSISLQADLPDSIVHLVDPPAPTLTNTVVQPSCGNNNGSIDLTVTGGTGPFTYLWSNGATSQDISGIGAGNYTVTVTAAGGCTFTHVVSLSNSSGPTISSIVTNQACVGTNTGSIDITPTGGLPPYTYLWNTGATSQDISGLAPGNYNVQVTASGCIATANFTVNPANPIIITGVVTNEYCNDQDGIIDITVSGGNPGYSYLWSNSLTTEDIDHLAQGTYTVTVTDQNLCTQTQSFTVINVVGSCIPTCDLTVTSQQIIDENCGQGNGSINITYSTSASPTSVLWSTGATTNSITNLGAGNYSVTITDGLGCSITQSYTIINDAGTLAITNPSVTNEACGNGQGMIEISVSGGGLPYSYLWSNGATTEDIGGLAAGNYTVTVTDGNGCEVYQSFSVNNNSGTLTQTWGYAMNATCGQSNGSIDITITGGAPPYNYLWSNGAITQDLVNIPAGNYSCQVTDQNGCIINTPVYNVLNNSGSLAITNINTDNEVCDDDEGAILLTISGGSIPYTFLWNTGATTQNISGLSAGNYNCTVTDNTGCSVSTGVVTIINESGTLALVSITPFNEVCGNGSGSIDLEVTGGTTPYQYLWNTGSNSEDLVSLSAGPYSCTITDPNGCTINANTIVQDVQGTLAIDNAVVTNENCGNGTGAVNLYVSGGNIPYAFAWNNGSTTEDISGLSAGIYTVTVTDNNGCTATTNATVINNSGTLSGSLVSLVNETCGSGNGSITITVSGGTGPYTYLWSNAATTQNLSGLPAGTYDCTITDNGGCQVNLGPFNINNSSGSLVISGAVITDENCNSNNGAINISVSGGTPVYTYLWSNGATTQDISAIASGNYTVTVSDAAGCSTSNTYVVNEDPGTLAISSIVITDETCNNNLGAINITVTGGSVPYTFLWSNAATTEDLINLNNGTYSVTVTDNSGCTVSASGLVVSNNPGNFTLSSISVTNEVCGNGAGSINVTLSNGTSPINYLWSNGAVTQDISGLSAGTYSATATDQSGCVLSYSAIVNDDPGGLTISGQTVTSSTCGNNNGSVDLTITGGTPGYTFLWNTGSTSEDITGLPSATYTVNISDNAGCETTGIYVVGNNGGTPVVTSSVIQDEICNNGSGSVTVNVSGGTGPYTYLWNLPTPCCSYTLTMNDFNGDGWGTASVNVYINAVLFGTYTCTGFTNTANISICTEDQIQLEYVPSGGGNFENSYSLMSGTTLLFQDGNPPAPGIQYTGTADCGGPTGQGTNTLSGIPAGTYVVTITDANGCSVTSSQVVGTSGGTSFVSGYIVTDDSCGTGGGAIDITVATANPPLSYIWSTSAVTQDVSSLIAGTYTVSITDNQGCEFDEIYTVNNISNGLTVATVNISDTYCGSATGSIDITPAGGTPGYTFQWSNGAVTEDISGVVAGTYTVTITDNTGCSTQSILTINNLTNGLSASTLVTNENCGNMDGSVDLTITGGFNPYDILWSNSAITEDISGLAAGTYSYTITDSAGCVVTGSAVVDPGNGNLAITGVNLTDDYCGMGQGVIDITVTGGTLPLNILWSNGQPTEDLWFIPSGNYTVTITDGLGCSISQSYTVNNITTYAIVDPANITDASCATCNDGAIDITIDWLGNPPGNLYFWWDNGEFTEDISNLLPGTYIVWIQDDFGCMVTDTFVVGNLSGIEEETWTVSLYPNPTDGVVYLQFDLLPDDFNIRLTDATGRILSVAPVASGNGIIQLDLSTFRAGTYFVEVVTDNKKWVKPVILKNDY